MRKFMTLAATVAVAAIGFTVPPAAATDTTVHLDVTVGRGNVPVADCDVTVPTGSNGVDVLEQALEDLCIVQYDTETHPDFGEFVTAIDFIYGAPSEALNATYWAIYVDGDFAQEGVSSLTFPTDGSTLGFDYDTWLV